jgi:hypothetical protein
MFQLNRTETALLAAAKYFKSTKPHIRKEHHMYLHNHCTKWSNWCPLCCLQAAPCVGAHMSQQHTIVGYRTWHISRGPETNQSNGEPGHPVRKSEKWIFLFCRRQIVIYNHFDCIKITNFMELNTNRESVSCAANQEFRSILLNPKVHYHFTSAFQFSYHKPDQWCPYRPIPPLQNPRSILIISTHI